MNTSSLENRRCAHHADREAVARCPQCERFFCRECIAEHDGRVLCANCLALSGSRQARRRSFLRRLTPLVQVAVGLLLLWGTFFYLGQALISLPDHFHEGTIWQDGWGES
ncbi:MAG: hypothetical protein PVJ53_08095 [Desulfobacterales bacterium]